MVLGYHVWRDRYASDPDIVGRALLVDGVPTTVLGVAPEGFRFPHRDDVWLPLATGPEDVERDEDFSIGVFGRLRDGVSLDEARLKMAVIAQRLAQDYPNTNERRGAMVTPYTLQAVGEDRSNLGYTGLAAVAFVLLIACSNVANLLLARTAGRSRELALRTALGASRTRVVTQILNESFVLAVPAAAAGLVLAAWGVREFNRAVAGQDWPYWFDVRIDAAALAVVVVEARSAQGRRQAREKRRGPCWSAPVSWCARSSTWRRWTWPSIRSPSSRRAWVCRRRPTKTRKAGGVSGSGCTRNCAACPAPLKWRWPIPFRP